jgi:hypothetical protein
MTKEVKTGLIIGGLLLLGTASFAAIRYKREKGRNILDDLLKNLPKKKSSVVADDPIKQSEAEFNEDRGYGYGDDGRPDWMPDK